MTRGKNSPAPERRRTGPGNLVARPLRALACLSASALLSGTGLAQDRLTIGGANAASPGTVDVPVYLRDASGTALGTDRPQADRIQALGFRLTWTPAGAVTTVTVRRGGVAASASPSFEFASVTPGSLGYVLCFGASSPFPLNLDAPGWGDPIAWLTVTLPPGLSPGTRIQLVPDPQTSLTSLSNANGTVGEASGLGLSLAGGIVSVGPLWGDPNQSGAIDVFDLTILAGYLVGNVSPGSAPFLADRDAVNLDPAKGPSVDVFDLVILANHIVGNVLTLPVP